MSSDARIWHTDTEGKDWVGNHDPDCKHMDPLPMDDKIEEITRCHGVRCWRWVITVHGDIHWLRGWTA